MPIVSIVFGGLLIGLGVWGYVTTDMKSVTALIPSFVGGVLVVLGLVGLVERFLKHAMHLAAMIGLLGCIAAAVRFVPKLIKGFDLNDKAALSTGGMALLCAIFVALCVNSFIQVRRRRRAAAALSGFASLVMKGGAPVDEETGGPPGKNNDPLQQNETNRLSIRHSHRASAGDAWARMACWRRTAV